MATKETTMNNGDIVYQRAILNLGNQLGRLIILYMM